MMIHASDIDFINDDEAFARITAQIIAETMALHQQHPEGSSFEEPAQAALSRDKSNPVDIDALRAMRDAMRSKRRRPSKAFAERLADYPLFAWAAKQISKSQLAARPQAPTLMSDDTVSSASNAVCEGAFHESAF